MTRPTTNLATMILYGIAPDFNEEDAVVLREAYQTMIAAIYEATGGINDELSTTVFSNTVACIKQVAREMEEVLAFRKETD